VNGVRNYDLWAVFSLYEEARQSLRSVSGMWLSGCEVRRRGSPSVAMTRLAIAGIRLFQSRLSPHLQRRSMRCRFWPTCSRHAILAFSKYGFVVGLAKTLGRLGRCRPNNYDSCVDLP